MKRHFSLLSAALVAAATLFTSCESSEVEEPSVTTPQKEDLTKFSTSSIVGLWACVGSDYKEYDPDEGTYKLYWYFNIQSDSKVQYINAIDTYGEYRKSDGYIHVAEGTKWSALVDANYIFDEQNQAIRCPSGTIHGFKVESLEELLGSDTVFYVKRYGLDEAQLFDNTGWIQDQYVIRAKGIRQDLVITDEEDDTEKEEDKPEDE